MSNLLPDMTTLCGFLLTYCLHSTCLILIVATVVHRLKNPKHTELKVLAWKLALVLPVITALLFSVVDLPHFGLEFALTKTDSLAAEWSEVNQTEAVSAGNIEIAETTYKFESMEDDIAVVAPTPESLQSSSHLPAASSKVNPAETNPAFTLPSFWITMTTFWVVLSTGSFAMLFIQFVRLRRLKQQATTVHDRALLQLLQRNADQLNIQCQVQLLESAETTGPITAGLIRPFILLPTGMSDHRQPESSEIEAVLAHELAHISRRDSLWIIISRVIISMSPFQPLNRWVARQLVKEMDFVADLCAVQTLNDSTGLIQSLIRLGDQLTQVDPAHRQAYSLAAGMGAFRSTLGRRVEALVNRNHGDTPVSRSLKFNTLIALVSGSLLVSACLPRAIAQTPQIRTTTMKTQLTTLALLIGLTAPVSSDVSAEDRPAAEKSVDLKTTPDPLPEGMRNFNGMLVGRIAAKYVEKGTFVAYVDAVPRVWRNSRAENPKSIVGKTVEVSGVFGKFLDVLVVTRKGETVEFECKYNDGRLVFPGELLRKVAPFKAEDYPELPEGFRGFRGALDAEIVKKDPNTFELIVKVNKVLNTGEESSAKNAKSIEGKSLMLAGFWNKKELYHSLKEGNRMRVGVRHISMRSDHLDVVEVARGDKELAAVPLNREKRERGEGEMRKEEMREGGLPRELRGFRGMLVGKLVKKDIERGTFTIKVDAIPRVWNNNRASNPKSFIGKEASATGVHGKLLDALVVTRVGETIEFGALQEEGSTMRVGEVLRKVAPVKPGDYPELPEGFRGFKGMLTAKIVKKDDHLKAVKVEIKSIEKAFDGSRARDAESIVGKEATLAGFWRRQEAFNGLKVGDTIRCGVEHPQRLSDHLSVIESVRKVED